MSISEKTAKTFSGRDVRSTQRDTVSAELNMDQICFNTPLSPNPIQ